MRTLLALRLIAGPLKASKLRYPRPLRKITRSLCSPTAWILRLQPRTAHVVLDTAAVARCGAGQISIDVRGT
jgi:hypothetical protein